MAGLCTPLPTLRRRPCRRMRTARGRCGSLLLHRKGLPPSTPCRSPGALRNPSMGPWKSSREFTACDFFLQHNFFVRLESPLLRPDPQCPNAVARRVCQGWPSLRYLLMISAMPGHTLTNPSTAARSLWSGWTGRGGARLSRTNIRAATLYTVGRNDPDHDAVLRIGSESYEAADPFCTTA